jgi:hypothetical protein
MVNSRPGYFKTWTSKEIKNCDQISLINRKCGIGKYYSLSSSPIYSGKIREPYCYVYIINDLLGRGTSRSILISKSWAENKSSVFKPPNRSFFFSSLSSLSTPLFFLLFFSCYKKEIFVNAIKSQLNYQSY